MLKLQNKSGIYKITCLKNKKVYIGQSVKVKFRCQNHRSKLRGNIHHNEHLQRAFNKYGEDQFTFEALHYCNEDQLNDFETYYIDLFNAMSKKSGFNLIYEYRGARKYSEETRKKMSESQKGRDGWNKGIPNTEDQRRQNSEANSGENNPFFGKKHSEETRKKMSEANRKRVRSHEELDRGAALGKALRKPVQQLKDGKVIAEFEGIRVAQRETGILSIEKVVKGKRKNAGGFQWRYKE